MIPSLTRTRTQRRLLAYLHGELRPPAAARLARRLAADSRLQAELDDLRQVDTALRSTPSPASPSARETAEVQRVARLALDHAAAGPTPARAGWLPQVAAAGLIFAIGVAAGSRLFPHTVVEQQIVTREVPVPQPVPVAVEVPVRVEVPVERVVTRWQTRTVTRVVYRDRPAADARIASEPARPPAPQAEPPRVVAVEPETVDATPLTPRPRTQVAAVRPASVDM